MNRKERTLTDVRIKKHNEREKQLFYLLNILSAFLRWVLLAELKRKRVLYAVNGWTEVFKEQQEQRQLVFSKIKGSIMSVKWGFYCAKK